MGQAKICGIEEGRTDIEKAQAKIEYLEGLIKTAGLERYAQVKEENERLKTTNAVLEERITQMEKRFNIEVENRVSSQVKDAKVNVEALRKENSGLKSGLNGNIGRVKAAQEREEIQYIRNEKLQSEAEVLRSMLESVNQSLAYNKEMLVKQEAQNSILLENNNMLKEQIVMLTNQKEMLEQMLAYSAEFKDKLSSLNVNDSLTNEQTKELLEIITKNKNYLVNSTVERGVVTDKEEAKSRINMTIDYIKNGEKTSKELAEKYGCNSTAALSSRINTIKKSWFDVINDYVKCENKVTSELKEKYSDKYKDIIDILEELN